MSGPDVDVYLTFGVVEWALHMQHASHSLEANLTTPARPT